MNAGKLSRLIRAYLSYIKRTKKPGYFPLRVWVEVTNICNLKCPICPNKDIPQEEKGLMDFSLYRNIIDQLGTKVNDIYLFHRGEPFLHPELADMIAYAKKSPATVRIHTNGTLLDKDNTDKIIKSGLDFISFSFDGYDSETYERHRVNSSFEATLDSILYFLKRKKELGSRLPFTALQVIEYGQNGNQKRQRQEFLQRFKNLPLNRFITRKPHNWGGLVDTGSQQKKNYLPCTFLWYAMVILYNGDLLPCPQDFQSRLKLGNIRKDSIYNIFNGDKMQGLRQKIAGRDIGSISPCASCDRLWRDTFMGLPTDYLKSFLKDNLGASS
ncbi:MAG: radical SAM/SPASM domain-containing protein [Actinomycetota bacterium]